MKKQTSNISVPNLYNFYIHLMVLEHESKTFPDSSVYFSEMASLPWLCLLELCVPVFGSFQASAESSENSKIGL